MLLCSGCTENPFFNDDDISPRNTVFGRVVLENESSAEGVLVWLAGMNTGTFTSADGGFRLRLPSPGDQPGGAYTGTLPLYFYVNNHVLDSTTLVMRDGRFLYSQGGLDARGMFANERRLKRLLSVRTLVSPEQLQYSQRDTLNINLLLEVPGEALDIRTTESSSALFTTLFFERSDKDTTVQTMTLGGQVVDRELAPGQYQVHLTVPIQQQLLPPGDYVVYPFIWVRQATLPGALLDYLNIPPETLANAYRYLPFYRRGGNLAVVR